eukprot:2232038-Rhodomonas_salina.1
MSGNGIALSGTGIAYARLTPPPYHHTLSQYRVCTQPHAPPPTTIRYLSTGHRAPYAMPVPGIAHHTVGR